jgi:UDP-glucose 4-epimerase
MIKRALVTGGAGFIGSNVVKLLREHGALVTVLDNLSSGNRHNLDSFQQVSLIEGDVRDEAAVKRAVAGVDVVFHLAASVGNTRSIENPIQDSEINVIGTLHVLEAARQAGVRKVVFSSSAGIFGELKTLPIQEDHPIDPDSPYGASKLAAEKLCLAYAKLYPLECVCLRYFNVYGVKQRFDAYGNVIPIFANCILRGQPMTIYGDGEQTRDFLHVYDVAKANLAVACLSGMNGVFNLGSGVQVTINGLARLIQEADGVQVGVSYAPPRKGDVRHSLADIGAAREAFGFEPQISLAEGLGGYMSWIRRDPISMSQALH